MGKIDIIYYCGDCSERWYERDQLMCGIMDKPVYENDAPPVWCPLPDANNELIQEVNKYIKTHY
jgi:hypothetical protein